MLKLFYLMLFLFVASCTSKSTYYRKIKNNTGHEFNIAHIHQGKNTFVTVPAFHEIILDTLDKKMESTDSLWQDLLYIFYDNDSIKKSIQQLSLWKFYTPDKNSGIYELKIDSSFFTYPIAKTSPILVDRFEELINKGLDSLIAWGFTPTEDKIDTLEDLSVKTLRKHWYLQAYLTTRRDSGAFMPTSIDFKTIKAIRSATFKKGWKIVIEEWEMQDEAAADQWMNIITNNTRNMYTKPPKRAWQEGQYIYFVMATAAHDWFEYGKALVKILKEPNGDNHSL